MAEILNEQFSINFLIIDLEYFFNMKLLFSEYHGISSVINIGSGNGSVPSGTKPLPEPILTKFQDTVSAAEKAKSWFTQRTTRDWRLGGPSLVWVVRQLII